MSKMDSNSTIAFDDCYDSGESLYVSCMQFNSLLKINKEKESGQFVDFFANESRSMQGMHHKIYCVEGVLYFTPDRAKGIHAYDLNNQKMEFYPIEVCKNSRVRCIDSYQIEDKLWLFYAYADNPIVVFDTRTHKVEYFDDAIKILPREIREREAPVFWSSFACSGNDVYGAIWNSPYIFHMNLASFSVEIISLKGWVNKLSGVTFDSDVLYMSELDEQNIKAWDFSNGSKVVYQPKEDMQLDSDCHIVYSNLIAFQKQIILIPNSGRRIFSLNENKVLIEEFGKLPGGYKDFSDERKGWRRFFSYKFDDARIRLCPSRGNMMLDINMSTKAICGYSFSFDEEGEKDYQRLVVNSFFDNEMNKGSIEENICAKLENYLEYVIEAKEEKKENIMKKNGERIWEFVKDKVSR